MNGATSLHTQALLLAADLNNSAAYRANAVSASIGFNTDTSQGFYGITPSAPIAMAAKGNADSTTHSTINGNVGNAAGLTPVITGTGTLDRADDALDTAALHKIFDEKKINTGFAIASTLGQNLSEFRTIKARDIDKAGKAPAKDANGNPIIGKDGQALTVAQAYQLDPNDVGYGQATGENYDTYTTLQKRWGNGGAGTILLSAIAGAANGNVTATGTQFAQNAVINVVRQYTATEIKRVADSLQNVDPVTGVRTNSVLSELVRGALHAMASCGGSVAVGGSCKTAAGAAAATVALNNLLIRKDVGTLTEAQKLAYSNLIQTLVTGAATGMNLEAVAGQQASQFEVENNKLSWTDNMSLSNLKYRLDQIKKAKTNLNVHNMEEAGQYADLVEAENNIEQKIKQLEHLDATQGFWEAHSPLIRKAGEVIVDFTPVIGDVKSFAQADSVADYFFAAAGLAPVVGDALQKSYKAAKAAGNIVEAKNVLSKAAAQLNTNAFNGRQFETPAIAAYGERLGVDLSKNTNRITNVAEDGARITIIPDAIHGETLIECKNVVNIYDSKQFRGYALTNQPIHLIVSPRTESISQTVKDRIRSREGGSIQIYNPVTKTFKDWPL